MPKILDNRTADQTIQLATGILENSFVATNTMTRLADERFAGRGDGDAVTMRVQKPLPVRQYPLYNDRAQPLKMDWIEEALVTLKVSKDQIYQATGVRDEVRDFDLNGNWGNFIGAQASALTNAYEMYARDQILNAQYEYVKHVDLSAAAIKEAAEIGQDATLNAVLDAKTALQKMGSPLASGTGVYALAGSEWAAHFRRNQRLTLAQGNNTPSAFADASIGNYAGIQIIEDLTIAPDELFLYTGDAFLFWNAAPGIPQGAAKGAVTSNGSLALRWILDYSADYAVDRSIFSAYTAFGRSDDFIEALDVNNNVQLSNEQYFVRGAKLVLGGSASEDILPGNGKGEGAGAKADSFLAKRFSNTRIGALEDKGIFTDLTYQNVVDGNVSAGTAAELGFIGDPDDADNSAKYGEDGKVVRRAEDNTKKEATSKTTRKPKGGASGSAPAQGDSGSGEPTEG